MRRRMERMGGGAEHVGLCDGSELRVGGWSEWVGGAAGASLPCVGAGGSLRRQDLMAAGGAEGRGRGGGRWSRGWRPADPQVHGQRELAPAAGGRRRRLPWTGGGARKTMENCGVAKRIKGEKKKIKEKEKEIERRKKEKK